VSKGDSTVGTGGSVATWVLTIFVTLLASPFVVGCSVTISSAWSDGNLVVTVLGSAVMILLVFLMARSMVSARFRGEAEKEKTRRENEEVRHYPLRKAREDEP